MTLRDAPATAGLTGLTVLVSGLILATGRLSWSAIAGGFIPARMTGALLPVDFGWAVPAWLTPLSATLLHGGIAHLALNLVMLVYCGMAVERALGAGATLLLYGIGGYAAAAGQWAFGPESVAPMIGASGAISAIVAAYALLYGERRARSVAGVPAGLVHALWLGAAWIGIQLLVGVAGLGGMAIAVGAHIGGFIAGLILTRPLLAWRYRAA
jgi:membrane associated rhomboid family serine protease